MLYVVYYANNVKKCFSIILEVFAVFKYYLTAEMLQLKIILV